MRSLVVVSAARRNCSASARYFSATVRPGVVIPRRTPTRGSEFAFITGLADCRELPPSVVIERDKGCCSDCPSQQVMHWTRASADAVCFREAHPPDRGRLSAPVGSDRRTRPPVTALTASEQSDPRRQGRQSLQCRI